MHKSLTLDKVLPVAEEQMLGMGNGGFCLACGEEQDGCEPDAEGYECESCGEMKVMGASELMMMLA